MASLPKQKTETILPRNYGFRIAESVFAITSVIGAMTAVATQKILWAAAPLTVSLLINLHNRRQLDALTRQYAVLGLTKIQQSLQHDLNILQGRLQEHQQGYGQTEQTECQAVMAMLRDAIVGLETKQHTSSAPIQLSHLTAVVKDLKTQVWQYHHHLESLNGDWKNTKALRTEHIHQLKTIKKSLEQTSLAKQSGSKSWSQVYPQLFRQFSTDLSGLQDRIQLLADQVKRRPPLDSAPLKTVPVHQLYAQISTLSMQMRAKQGEWSTQLVAYQASMKGLHMSLKHIQEQLNALQAMALRPDQNIVPISELSVPMQDMLAPLQIQCVNLSNRLDHFIFEAKVTQGQSQQLQQLKEQISAMQLQVLAFTNEDLTLTTGDEVLP